MGSNFFCKLKSVKEIEHFKTEITYDIRDNRNDVIQLPEPDISGFMKGKLKVIINCYDESIKIPTHGTYEEIEKHFELWEDIN